MIQQEHRLGCSDLRKAVTWRDAIAEVLCSMLLLVFLTFNQIIYFSDWFRVTPTHAGLVMAFVVFALIESFGHISGCHMNPGVTLIVFCRADISFMKALLYVVAQCCGAAAGSGIVYSLTPPSHRDVFGPFQPAEALGPYRGMGLEVIISFLLFFTILGVTDPKRGRDPCLPGLPIGCAVGVDIMCAMSYTGAAMNPLIALGPAVITGNFKHHWIYWAGPMLGAAISVAVYMGLTSIKDKKPDTDLYDDKHDPEHMTEMVSLLEGLLRERQEKKIYNSEKGQCL